MNAKSGEIRQYFLKYFESKGHKIVPSHSLIPPADPTLYFVNAGMVQFKDVFTGERDPGYRRAASVQKCLRVSGKHNDLEQVGRTPRHHTFFEMLGNFSFGDYFKREAIHFAWELLTEGYGIPAQRLWVTIHPDDAEAKEVWLGEIGVPIERVLCDPSNFWAMGETGPCGPCSEIHIDKGEMYPGTDPVADPGDRFMELWNLVFMQFNRDEHGVLHPLPAPSIDTGMGLERLCAVLQGVASNYETDLFAPLIRRTAEMAGIRLGESEEADVALRVIADHARATAFLIADGVYPENEGRGYVLRRLMRRALRYGHKIGFRGPFFTKICLAVAEEMGEGWPELRAAAGVMEQVAGQEEERFLRTLSSGLQLLEEQIERTKLAGGKVLDGHTVFVLYDTHGFPADLTRLVAEEHGLGIDEEGFEREMEGQRERGRASWKAGDRALEPLLAVCDELGIRSRFVGYERLEAESEVLLLFTERAIEECAGGEVLVLVGETPFYGEAGGQVGDTGTIEWASGLAKVKDTLRPREDVIVHVCEVQKGTLALKQRVFLRVDAERRAMIRRHHSATHLLHFALRKVLGSHVRQRGSLVAEDRLRFDFSHPAALSKQEVAAIEDLVASLVLRDDPVETVVTTQEDAIKRGALHFFEDKYGSVVRMVCMGESKELCGGTHVSRTGEIGLVKIVSETGISAGVRRIEAIAGPLVLGLLRERDDAVSALADLLKCEPGAVVERTERLVGRVKALEKEVADLKVKFAAGSPKADSEIVRVGELELLAQNANDMDTKTLRELADVLRGRLRKGYALITREDGETLQVLLAATKNAPRPAADVLREVLSGLGGKGGGTATLAQGGVRGVKAKDVLDGVVSVLRTWAVNS